MVAGELRWPLVKTESGGAVQVLEPVVQLVWAPSGTESIPNEDSTVVEFDEGNLFSLNRFPGSDAVERGPRANIGLSWTRIGADGLTIGATVGRVFRAGDEGQFSLGSGLDGTASDWLAAVQLAGGGFTLTNRALFDDGFAVTKAEVRLDGRNDRAVVAASYVWAVADLTENRGINTSEVTVDGSYDLTPGWTASVLGRYDLIAERPSRAGLGLVFRNECILVDVSLSRRFTSSTTVQPTTSFGVSVDLLGFGSGAEAGPARTCRR